MKIKEKNKDITSAASFIIALAVTSIVLGNSYIEVFAQTLQLPTAPATRPMVVTSPTSSAASTTAANSTATSTSTTTPEEKEIDTEEVRGRVNTIEDNLLVIDSGENFDRVRRIKIGSRSAVEVTRDGEEATFEDIRQGDAVIVSFTTDAQYSGTVVKEGATTDLVIVTDDDRRLTFTPGPDLEVSFEYQRTAQAIVRATAVGSGTIPIIPTLKAGTEVEVTIPQQSIVAVQAYSSGEFPREMNWLNWLMLSIMGISAVALGVKYGAKKAQNK